MSDSQFHTGMTAVVTKPQIGRGGFQGMVGTVKEVDVMGQPFVKVLLDFSESGSEDQWFTEGELSVPIVVRGETLEQKRDRLKAELAVAEAELHLANKPQAAKLAAGTVIWYINPSTSLPAMYVKQGGNKWLLATVTTKRDSYLPLTHQWADFDVQAVIDKAWESGRGVDIYPGK